MAHVQTLVVIGAFVLLGLMLDTGMIADAIRHLVRRRRTAAAPNPDSEPAGTPPAADAGHAATALRPFGRVTVAGVEHPAKSDFGYIEPGTPVAVTRRDGDVLVVRARPTSDA